MTKHTDTDNMVWVKNYISDWIERNTSFKVVDMKLKRK